MIKTVVILLAALPLLACGGGGSGTDVPDVQTGTLTGLVTDGAAVASVAVSASRAGQTTRTATTGADGRFTMASLAPGSWQVGLTMPATHEADPAHALPVSATVVADQTVSVTLNIRRRPTVGTIGGVVREGLIGLAGATVDLAGPGVSRQTTTGATGTYAFLNVAPGSFTVALTVPSGFQMAAGELSTKPVTLAGGQSATVDFNVTRPDNGVLRTITLANFTFSPQSLTITAGTRVRWTNPTNMEHTVTPDGHAEWTDTALAVGTSFEHVFNTPGTYNYYCSPHRIDGMTGVIIVQ